MQRPTLFFMIITAGVGLGLFHLKYQVMNLEKDHARIQKNIRETKDTIHVLKAEWTHLNDPKRLQRLCEQYLKIAPIRGSQLVSLTQVTGGEPGGDPGYDRSALDQLVAELASDATLAALGE
jgi:cell division protein FtsL